MRKISFNKHWEFTFDNALDAYNNYGLQKFKEAYGAPEQFYKFNNWKKIDLPHDWAVALPKNLNTDTLGGCRAKTYYNKFMTEKRTNEKDIYSIGWYRKVFDFQDDWKNKHIFLDFEGIYRNWTVWINGIYMDNHFSGYTGSVLEITDMLCEGENSVCVRVDAEHPEGWWYEGAGIYRNVNLLIGEKIYFKPYETVIKANGKGEVSVSAILVNDSECQICTNAIFRILDSSKKTVAECLRHVCIQPYGEHIVYADLIVENPRLWDIDNPNLYTLTIDAIDFEEEIFGFRMVEFDSEKGFALNGKQIKLNGACVHQDFGGVGVALSDNLNRYKIAKLKEMGVNAYRASHHPPSPSLVRACDELGMLLLDETRIFGTSPEAIRELTDLIKRDRNHPSVFIWCIGNEEGEIQNLSWGQKIAKKVCRIARTLDDTRLCTYGGNNGTNYEGINGGVDVRGVNYIRNGNVDVYHNEHPTQAIIGTEESSYVLSRGCGATDLSKQTLVSNGMITMPWGSTHKGWVKYAEARPWFSGGFMWTGFDYRGEPMPFEYSAFSSYFGAIDLCGMEKSPFYYYKSWWTDEPILKILPHWSYIEGENVTVNVFTNCEHIILKLNGLIIAEQDVQKYDAPEFSIGFAPGILEVFGIKKGIEYYDCVRTSGKPIEIRQQLILPCEKEGDIGIVELNAFDSAGVLCQDCEMQVSIELFDGDIVGVGNGNPNDCNYEQKPDEERFHYISAFETENGLYTIPQKQENIHIHMPYRSQKKKTIIHENASDFFEDDYRDVFYTFDDRHIYDSKNIVFVANCTLNEDYEYLEFERLHGEARVFLDGVEIGNNLLGFSKNNRPYRFYCNANKGNHEIKVDCTIFDGTSGGISGKVKFGKIINKNIWSLNLHGGKGRVFIKYHDTYSLKTYFGN